MEYHHIKHKGCPPELIAKPIHTDGFGNCGCEEFAYFLIKLIVIYILLVVIFWIIFALIGMFVEDFMLATFPAALGAAFFALVIGLLIMIAFNTNVRGAAIYRVQ